ncbi:hypothetical protein [Nocardia wallacei]|uniref:RHIM domain-containing protein n=1 Tax=Nocardia wallacei TaxID=480035 RepID=A0A7G1KU90_9NOCA|nr:hypothetical protein [Nocardia wallacei]BCK57509.1 hypothetical protein NWFMUON74_52810 [Nocardia wallacei]
MDPFTIITTALIAGAAAGGKDAASAAVRDAYAALRERLTSGGDDSAAVAVIEANEAASGSNIDELEDVLRRHRWAEDDELRSVAETILSQLPSDRVEDARSRIDLRQAQGVQIGDHGTQHNTFG